MYFSSHLSSRCWSLLPPSLLSVLILQDLCSRCETFARTGRYHLQKWDFMFFGHENLEKLAKVVTFWLFWGQLPNFVIWSYFSAVSPEKLLCSTSCFRLAVFRRLLVIGDRKCVFNPVNSWLSFLHLQLNFPFLTHLNSLLKPTHLSSFYDDFSPSKFVLISRSIYYSDSQIRWTP